MAPGESEKKPTNDLSEEIQRGDHVIFLSDGRMENGQVLQDDLDDKFAETIRKEHGFEEGQLVSVLAIPDHEVYERLEFVPHDRICSKVRGGTIDVEMVENSGQEESQEKRQAADEEEAEKDTSREDIPQKDVPQENTRQEETPQRSTSSQKSTSLQEGISPQESASRKKNAQLTARATAGEKREIKRRAAEAGLSMSRYLVRCGLSDGKTEEVGETWKEEDKELREELRQLHEEIRRVGDNISELAGRLDRGERVSKRAARRAVEAGEQAADMIIEKLQEV
jgi:hypothetical protein